MFSVLQYKLQIILAWSVEIPLSKADLDQINMIHSCMGMVLMIAEP